MRLNGFLLIATGQLIIDKWVVKIQTILSASHFVMLQAVVHDYKLEGK